MEQYTSKNILTVKEGMHLYFEEMNYVLVEWPRTVNNEL